MRLWRSTDDDYLALAAALQLQLLATNSQTDHNRGEDHEAEEEVLSRQHHGVRRELLGILSTPFFRREPSSSLSSLELMEEFDRQVPRRLAPL